MSGHIHRARREERDRLKEIRAAVRENQLSDPTRVTDEHYQWFADHPGIWVWDDEGTVLGFSAADPRNGTIFALFVAPGHERRGVGRALLEAACDSLRRTGHRTAMLTTAPGTRAERFYRTAGWHVIGTSDRGELLFRSAL